MLRIRFVCLQQQENFDERQRQQCRFLSRNAGTTSNLTALFDSQGDADKAIDRLKEAGITEVRLLPGYESSENATVTADQTFKQIWRIGSFRMTTEQPMRKD